jgi:hypothetical protein
MPVLQGSNHIPKGVAREDYNIFVFEIVMRGNLVKRAVSSLDCYCLCHDYKQKTRLKAGYRTPITSPTSYLPEKK